MLSSQMLWPKLWSSCVAFIFSPSLRLRAMHRRQPLIARRASRATDERGLQRHECSAMMGNESRRVVSCRASRRNTRSVHEAVDGTDEALATIHGMPRTGHHRSALPHRAPHSRRRDRDRQERPEPERSTAPSFCSTVAEPNRSVDQCFASSACQLSKSAPSAPRFAARSRKADAAER